MRQAEIYFKSEKSGTLTQLDNGSFIFEYDDLWISDNSKPPISLTLPKNKKEYKSNYLFPFFYNMLPEGTNKQIVCKNMRIDKDDFFSLLLITARYDTIGAVTVKKI
ncbi:MAG: HipA N-terminal domain-containing protein [Flavobacteriaceae bacterium]|nr:HipA N-terminal domain-containing protein [Flavobacteriaceae bacterium]